MAIAYVNKATATVDAASGTAVGSVLNGVSAGNCLVVTASVYNTSTTWTITSVTDGTNTYTVRSSVHTQSGNHRQYQIVAYALNVSSGNFTPTVTLSGANASNTYAEICISEYSGVATSSAEDAWDANDDQDITTNDVNAGPITTTEAADLIVGAGGLVPDSSTSIAWSLPTSWTDLWTKNDGFTTGTGHCSGYWLPAATQTTYTPQWSHLNISGNLGSALVVALKQAAGGGGGNVSVAWIAG